MHFKTARGPTHTLAVSWNGPLNPAVTKLGAVGLGSDVYRLISALFSQHPALSLVASSIFTQNVMMGVNGRSLALPDYSTSLSFLLPTALSWGETMLKPQSHRRRGAQLVLITAISLLVGGCITLPPLAASVATGANHTCTSITGSNTVKCWGSNYGLQMGNGTTFPLASPAVTVSNITTAISATAGFSHSCALLLGGTVKCWGTNGDFQLGNADNQNSAIPVSVVGITTAKAVSAGGYHTCALLQGGTVMCWGLNGDGQLGTGQSASDIPYTVNGITTATAISTGLFHTCARLSDSTVWCWGRNGDGQLGNGSLSNSPTPVMVGGGITTATTVSAGWYHTCARLSSGSLKCWGRNDFGQLGNGSTGGNSHTPVNVSAITTAKTVSAGGYFTCASLSGGAVNCWGHNVYGQLGRGSGNYTNSNIPVAVNFSIPVTAAAVSAGGYHACATPTFPNSVSCWGLNDRNQMGGPNPPNNTPTPVTTPGVP